MTIETAIGFFKWCSIINVGLMMFSLLMMAAIGDLAYKIHNKFYPMERKTFNVLIYSFFGVYKVLIFVFNIVPYIALRSIS